MKRYLFFLPSLLLLVLTTSFVRGTDIDVTPESADGKLWFDATLWPTEGKGWEATNRYFCRIPANYEELVPDSIKSLAQDSAGLLVRFRTNAASISVQYKLWSNNLAMPHMPATGVSGLDLYVQTNGKWNWVGCTMPNSQEATVDIVSGIGNEMRNFILYLPLYNGVDILKIGVPEGAEFHAMAPRPERPIVYYGTSIAQGGCASRPGNVFTGMLGRRLDYPIINLGFSGSARMEPVMADLLAELDPILYVIDAVPNMNAGLIDERGVNFVKTLRDKHPETPILLVDGRRYSNTHIRPAVAADCDASTEALLKVYKTFLDQGDDNIFFLSAENQIGEELDYDSTMDSSHLNDLGMYRMTDSLEKIIRPLWERELAKGKALAK